MKPLLVSARLIDSAVISQTPTLFNSVSTAGPGLPLATGQSAARLKRVTDPSSLSKSLTDNTKHYGQFYSSLSILTIRE